MTAAEAQSEQRRRARNCALGQRDGLHDRDHTKSGQAKPYRAALRRDGKEQFLGSFATAEEAALVVARDAPTRRGSARRRRKLLPPLPRQAAPPRLTTASAAWIHHSQECDCWARRRCSNCHCPARSNDLPLPGDVRRRGHVLVRRGHGNGGGAASCRRLQVEVADEWERLKLRCAISFQLTDPAKGAGYRRSCATSATSRRACRAKNARSPAAPPLTRSRDVEHDDALRASLAAVPPPSTSCGCADEVRTTPPAAPRRPLPFSASGPREGGW